MTERHSKVLLIVVICMALLCDVFLIVYNAIFPNQHTPIILVIGVVGLALICAFAFYYQHKAHNEFITHLNRALSLASETVPYMRKGLDYESCQAVCELLLPAVTACSVCITDQEVIKGFAGVAAKTHEPGTPIHTSKTKKTLEDGKTRTIKNAEGAILAEDSKEDRKLKATIIVPLQVQDKILGTLKFFYDSPNKIDKTQRVMVEGFGQLLSTQLSLAYLEQQTELATRMELKALQTQINPHFLFNTINTIAATTRRHPEKAREMLREFAVYYRRLLENAEDLIPLSKEIEQTQRYLMFQLARFGENSVVMNIEIQPGLEELRVPAFLLQPLIENAVGHGRRPEGDTLHIQVSVYRKNDNIIVTVADDGVGIPNDDIDKIVEGGKSEGMGIALSNIHSRLCGYFGPGSGLHLDSIYGQGTTVYLTLENAVLKLHTENDQKDGTIKANQAERV